LVVQSQVLEEVTRASKCRCIRQEDTTKEKEECQVQNMTSNQGPLTLKALGFQM